MGFFSRRGSGSEASQKKPETTYSNAFLDKAFSSPGVQRDVLRLSRSERESDFPREERQQDEFQKPEPEHVADVISLDERRTVAHQVDTAMIELQQAVTGGGEYNFHIIQGKDEEGNPYNTNPAYWKGLEKKLGDIVGVDLKDASMMAGNIAQQIESGRVAEVGKLFSQFEHEVNDVVGNKE